MDVTDLQTLLAAMAEADIHELALETGDYKLQVKRGPEQVLAPVVAVDPPVAAAVAPAAPAPAPAAAPPEPDVVPEASAAAKNLNLIEVKAPIVGTFYSAPAPDASPYVKEGDRVGTGQVLCIIEAMKLMNEIEAEVSGTVAEILVRNEEPVEYGQVLFTIDPS